MRPLVTVALVTVALATLALASGCLGRAQDLIDDANARVIITGAAPDVALQLAVSGERRAMVALDGEPLVVYLVLAPGAHEGLVREEAEPARCARFSLLVEDGSAPAVASVDLRTAPPCADIADAGPGDDGGPPDAGDAGVDGGPPDAGPDDAGPDDAGVDGGPPPAAVFVHLEESVTIDPCLELLCLQVTRAEADGTVTWLDLVAAEVSGEVSAADVDALAAATLSAEADALFAGTDPDCPQPRPIALAGVSLERRYRPSGAANDVIETVGVAGCGGLAAELRSRLDFLRELALGL